MLFTKDKDTENISLMNIIFEKITNDYNLRIARFDENPDFLFQEINDDLDTDEIEKFNQIKNNKRKVEWLGTRILLKNILGSYSKIHYNDKGNPYITQGKHLSVTHSENCVGIIVSRNKKVGIDTEFVSDRILRTAHKFIPEDILQNLTGEKAVEKMYLHWCCKETLFKIKGGGGYDFKKDFILFPFRLKEEGEIISKVVKTRTEQFKLSYRLINQDDRILLLVWHG